MESFITSPLRIRDLYLAAPGGGVLGWKLLMDTLRLGPRQD